MTQQLILIRPRPQSLALLIALREQLGYAPDVIVSPLMEIETLNVVLPQTMQPPFIFTSQNAVRIAVPLMTQRGPAICVGEKVAQKAIDEGFRVIQTYETASALLADGSPKGTYLRAEQISQDLNASAQLDEFVIYRQAPVDITQDALRAIQNDALIPIYSEYAANRLLDTIGDNATKVTAICISNKVASVLTRGNFAQIYTAPAPNSRAMLNEIVKLQNH